VHVDDATTSSSSCVIEVFLAGIHDEGSRKQSFEESSAGEITLKLFYNIWHCVLLYFRDDTIHEGHPIIQIFICIYN
jgi:hypothetical protein